MYKSKLCLNINDRFGISAEDQIRMFKKAGFDGFFTMWDENLAAYRRVADEVCMIYQSVHAGFMNAEKMLMKKTFNN